MTINIRLKNLRKQRGLTLEEVADMLSLNKATVQKYESGVIAGIPSDKIEALATIYKTTPAFIMGWDSDVERLADTIYARLQTDKRFLEIVETLNNLDEEKLNGVQAMLALIK